MVAESFLYGDLTYQLNGMFFAVQNELGRFAREKQYANLFEQKLKDAGIPFHRELRVGDSGNILDFLIDEKVVVEFKAKAFLMQDDYSQIKRYLHILNLELGILVNFRSERLHPKRVLRRGLHP